MLNAVRKPGLQIAHERNAGVLAAVANVPRDNQLGVGINRRPRPHVANLHYFTIRKDGRPPVGPDSPIISPRYIS